MQTPDNDIKMRILLAAKKLFAEQGFDGTSVRQICEAAGANVALVSYYFGGKENMFGELFQVFFPNDLIASIDQNMEPLEGVKLAIREITLFRHNDPELIRIIQQEIITNSARIQKIREYVMPMWFLLRRWVEEGRNQGLFHYRSLDTAFMSVVGALLFHRQSEYWRAITDEGEGTAEQLAEDLTSFILGGLGASEA
ncbi:TetR family transcriptional regulator [Paenibacillus sp. NPDC058071]|uniref:TetR family transcriptional regulator n=1 Tax=Paenibacillus sp. NPDC058071 TaxID=3346326 RepID=UPI0036DF0C9C